MLFDSFSYTHHRLVKHLAQSSSYIKLSEPINSLLFLLPTTNYQLPIMRLSRILSLAVLSGLSTANECVFHNGPGTATYTIWTSAQVGDVPDICGGLWDNLKRFVDCLVVTSPSCEDSGDGRLEWRFTTLASCNTGMIESTWVSKHGLLYVRKILANGVSA
jgi:hypothetical protein